MTKRDEIDSPDSCLNKAAPDELIFVLREKDLCAGPTIFHWCILRVLRGLNKWSDPKLLEAREMVRIMKLKRGG